MSSVIFSISLLVVLIRILLVVFNGGFNDKELFIDLVFILLPPSGILKLRVGRVVIYGEDGH